MLTGLRVGLREWDRAGPGVLAAAPLEWVEPADRPGVRLEVEHTERGWFLAGRLEPGDRGPPAEAREGSTTRAALVVNLRVHTARVLARLREFAGDRWPGGPV